MGALMCKRCETCYEVIFHIYLGNCRDEDPKNAVGKIIRQTKTVASSILTDCYSFEVFFPEIGCSAYDKLMIIGATIMLDYTYFEEAPSDKDFEDQKKRIPKSEYD